MTSTATIGRVLSDRDRRIVERASPILRAMSHPIRLQALLLMREGEKSVSEINERVDISQSGLSQHLAVLRNAGLVETRRERQTIYYRLTDRQCATDVMDMFV